MAAVMSGAGAWEWKAEVQTRSKPVVGAGVSFHRHVSSITVSLLQSSPVLTQRVLSAALSPEGRLATDRSGHTVYECVELSRLSRWGPVIVPVCAGLWATPGDVRPS